MEPTLCHGFLRRGTDATIQLTYRSGQTTGPELIASMVTSSWSNGGIPRNNELANNISGIHGTFIKTVTIVIFNDLMEQLLPGTRRYRGRPPLF